MKQEKWYFVYIMANPSRVIYVGVTGSIERRVLQHRSGEGSVFTRRYRCHRLVYFERFSTSLTAIAREKQIKGWTRARKVALIEAANPKWEDLSAGWGKPLPTPAHDRTPMQHEV